MAGFAVLVRQNKTTIHYFEIYFNQFCRCMSLDWLCKLKTAKSSDQSHADFLQIGKKEIYSKKGF